MHEDNVVHYYEKGKAPFTLLDKKTNDFIKTFTEVYYFTPSRRTINKCWHANVQVRWTKWMCVLIFLKIGNAVWFLVSVYIEGGPNRPSALTIFLRNDNAVCFLVSVYMEAPQKALSYEIWIGELILLLLPLVDWMIFWRWEELGWIKFLTWC